MSQATGWSSKDSKDCKGALDLVITIAVIVDWTGIYKARVLLSLGEFTVRFRWPFSRCFQFRFRFTYLKTERKRSSVFVGRFHWSC